MKNFLLLMTFFFFGQKGIAQEWVLVHKDSLSGTELFIKSTYESRSTVTGIARVWTKHLLDETTVEKDGKEQTYRNATLLVNYLIDTKRLSLKILSTITLDSKGKEVNFWSDFKEEEEWHEIFPDTQGAHILSKVQELFFKPEFPGS